MGMGMSPEMKRNRPLVNDRFQNSFVGNDNQASMKLYLVEEPKIMSKYNNNMARTVPSFVSDANFEGTANIAEMFK